MRGWEEKNRRGKRMMYQMRGGDKRGDDWKKRREQIGKGKRGWKHYPLKKTEDILTSTRTRQEKKKLGGMAFKGQGKSEDDKFIRQ